MPTRPMMLKSKGSSGGGSGSSSDTDTYTDLSNSSRLLLNVDGAGTLAASPFEMAEAYGPAGVLNPTPSGILKRHVPISTRRMYSRPDSSLTPGGAPISSWPFKASYPVTTPLKISERSRRKFSFINIHDVIDNDSGQDGDEHLREVLLGSLLDSAPFRSVVLVAITMNSIMIGLQTVRVLADDYTPIFQAFDIMFLTIFMMEIALKWLHGFTIFWKVGWNVFDFLLVVVSLLGNGLEFLSTGRLLRIFRVLRAFRSLRSVSVFKGLQMVVSTIARSLPDMINIVVLLLIVMFVFAIIGIDMFGSSQCDSFASISKAMFTLFIFMSMDGWMDIYNELKQSGYGTLAAVYCVIFITIGGFIFTNIIAGVTVTNLQEANNEARKLRRIVHRNLSGNNPNHDGDEIPEANNDGQGEENDKSPPEELDATPVSIYKANVKSDVWKSQVPAISPTYANISEQELENYLLTLVALEENLCERQQLKAEMEKVLKKIKSINMSKSDQAEDDLYDSGDEELFAADILTKIIRNEERMAASNNRIGGNSIIMTSNPN